MIQIRDEVLKVERINVVSKQIRNEFIMNKILDPRGEFYKIAILTDNSHRRHERFTTCNQDYNDCSLHL